MLCPNCGADVGDELKLCPNCRFEPTMAASVRNASSSTRNIIPDDVDEFDTSPPSVADALRQGKGPLNILIRYVLPAIAGLLASVAFMTFYGPKGMRPSIPMLQKSPPADLQLSSSRAVFGTEALRLESVLLYNNATSVLHVGFYRSLPPSFNRELLSSVPSLADVRGERPDILLSIRFSGKDGCKAGQVDAATLTMNASLKGFPLAQPQISLVAFGLGAVDAGANSLKPGLSEIVCSLDNGGRASGRFAASPRLVFNDESKIVMLDLAFNGQLIHTSVADELFYRSTNAQDTVALLNRKKNQVTVGFFSEPLPVSASERMRTAQSLLAVTDKQPEAVISFAYEPGTTKLATEKLKSYAVTLYRGKHANQALPGSESSITVAYLGMPAEQLATSRLQGALGEGLVVSGAFQGTAIKQIDGRPFKLGWSLDISAPLLDVSEESLGGDAVPVNNDPVPAASPSASATPLPPTIPTPTAVMASPTVEPTVESTEFFGDTPASPQGATLSLDGAKIEFRSIVPIFYEDTGDVALGFYVDKLSAADTQEIQRRRLLQASVKNMRPSMVVILDFRAGSPAAEEKELVGYTIYFYRDASGQLGFPGVHESLSFKRPREKFTASDQFSGSGPLQKGGKVQLMLQGTSANEKSPADFAWSINSEVELP